MALWDLRRGLSCLASNMAKTLRKLTKSILALLLVLLTEWYDALDKKDGIHGKQW